MNDVVTAYVGQTVTEDEALALRRRVDALGWQMKATRTPAGHRVQRIAAPAGTELTPEEIAAIAAWNSGESSSQ